MKPIIINVKFLPAAAMAIFPLIFIKHKALRYDTVVVNHELIHFRQQLELLILPFYVLYVLFYCINLVRFRNHCKAYRQIPFEKEAYSNDKNSAYLSHRKPFSWLTYL